MFSRFSGRQRVIAAVNWRARKYSQRLGSTHFELVPRFTLLWWAAVLVGNFLPLTLISPDGSGACVTDGEMVRWALLGCTHYRERGIFFPFCSLPSSLFSEVLIAVTLSLLSSAW